MHRIDTAPRELSRRPEVVESWSRRWLQILVETVWLQDFGRC